MKTSKLLLTAAISLSLSATASHAISIDPLNITMYGGVSVVAAPSSALPSYGDANVLAWLTGDVAAYNTAHATSYPVPTGNLTGAPLEKVNVPTSPSLSSLTLTLGSYDYLFLHWGGQGGGTEQAYYIGGSSGSFDFLAPPGGPPAIGGLSFYSFYGPTPEVPTRSVPDAGGTFASLGLACLCLMGFARKTKLA
jgi:hypothetical protein